MTRAKSQNIGEDFGVRSWKAEFLDLIARILHEVAPVWRLTPGGFPTGSWTAVGILINTSQTKGNHRSDEQLLFAYGDVRKLLLMGPTGPLESTFQGTR